MQIKTFYGLKLYDLGDEKAPVCEIWSFYHNLNTIVIF